MKGGTKDSFLMVWVEERSRQRHGSLGEHGHGQESSKQFRMDCTQNRKPDSKQKEDWRGMKLKYRIQTEEGLFCHTKEFELDPEGHGGP